MSDPFVMTYKMKKIPREVWHDPSRNDLIFDMSFDQWEKSANFHTTKKQELLAKLAREPFKDYDRDGFPNFLDPAPMNKNIPGKKWRGSPLKKFF